MIVKFQRIENEIDQDRKLTDYFFVDGASNVKSAGQILCTTYPWAMCFHKGESHCIQWWKKWSTVRYRNQICNMLYVMHRVLHKKLELKATIHNPCFSSLSKSNCVEAAVKDIEDKVFGMQFIVLSVLCFLIWMPQGTVIPTSSNEENLFLVEASRWSSAWLTEASWWQGSVWINEGSDFIWLWARTGWSFRWNNYRKECQVIKEWLSLFGIFFSFTPNVLFFFQWWWRWWQFHSWRYSLLCLIQVQIDWNRHVQSWHGIYVYNLFFKLTAQDISMLITTTSGS